MLEPVRDYKARHASTLLTFDAVGGGRRAAAERAAGRARRGRAEPRRRVPGAALALGLIRAYQLSLLGLLGRQCRYLPTCSDYAAEAVRRHGVWPGGWMAAARLCRCQPCGGWGYDPVPLRCEPVPAGRPGATACGACRAVTPLATHAARPTDDQDRASS